MLRALNANLLPLSFLHNIHVWRIRSLFFYHNQLRFYLLNTVQYAISAAWSLSKYEVKNQRRTKWSSAKIRNNLRAWNFFLLHDFLVIISYFTTMIGIHPLPSDTCMTLARRKHLIEVVGIPMNCRDNRRNTMLKQRRMLKH